MRGGEKVLEQISQLYPDADIYTHVADRSALSDRLNSHNIFETFISRLPGARRHYQKYLPLMPRALEALDLQEYDLVISSEAGPAKGVITRPDSVHVCYCHSPMRYIWDQYHVYRASAGRVSRLMMSLLAPRLRVWDTASAARIDAVMGNSRFIVRRINKCWGRSATMVYPPVDIEAFLTPDPVEPGDFYLYAGELASYKRVDLVVDAFHASGRRLVIIGEGAEKARLEAKSGNNISFLGRVPFEVLKDHYARCRGLVFPGIEDFGIVPLEASASGRPVLAYAGGGALETVVDGLTGTFFYEPTAASLNEGLARLEAMMDDFDSEKMREHANGFRPEVFRTKFKAVVDKALRETDLALAAPTLEANESKHE